jgi:hypothetical protein
MLSIHSASRAWGEGGLGRVVGSVEHCGSDTAHTADISDRD